MKCTTPITWTKELLAAFQSCKESLTQATLLAHPHPTAPLALVTDASTTAMGAVLRVQCNWQPLAFFSRKLSPQQTYSTYDRELLVIYEAVRYFRHMLEARHFTIYTDHKLLTFAFQQKRDVFPTIISSPRLYRTIQHISGQENIMADTLCRVDTISAPATHEDLAKAQESDTELQKLLIGGTSMQLEKIPVPGTSTEQYCDMAHERQRPFVPSTLRRQVFSSLHSLSHSGIRATEKRISQHFV